MNVAGLDFENFFDHNFSLKKPSIPKYVYDPRFHLHGLADRWPDSCVEFRKDVEHTFLQPKDQYGEELESTTVAGHHTQSDMYVLNQKYAIRPHYLIGTMLLGHQDYGHSDHHGQSLSVGALAVHHDVSSTGIFNLMYGVDVRQLTERSSYAGDDGEVTFQLVERLIGGLETVITTLHVAPTDYDMEFWFLSDKPLRYEKMRRAIRYLDDFGQEAGFTPEGPSIDYGNGYNRSSRWLC